MTNNWFECKVRYDKVVESGMTKKVTETYLVDALSFTEAEARIIEELSTFITGELLVSDIRRFTVSEMFSSALPDADKWYHCKLEYISLDEKNGKEKKTKFIVLVKASSLSDAMNTLENGMASMLGNYNAVCIKETDIMEVYFYQPK